MQHPPLRATPPPMNCCLGLVCPTIRLSTIPPPTPGPSVCHSKLTQLLQCPGCQNDGASWWWNGTAPWHCDMHRRWDWNWELGWFSTNHTHVTRRGARSGLREDETELQFRFSVRSHLFMTSAGQGMIRCDFGHPKTSNQWPNPPQSNGTLHCIALQKSHYARFSASISFCVGIEFEHALTLLIHSHTHTHTDREMSVSNLFLGPIILLQLPLFCSLKHAQKQARAHRE